jgi:hypothetical protein
LAFSLKDVGIDSAFSRVHRFLMVDTFAIQLPEDDGNVAVSKRPPREFKIRIRKAGQLLTREIINFLIDKPHDESTRFTGTLYISLSFSISLCLYASQYL